MTASLAVGIMSGTSLDGVSTALVRLTHAPPGIELRAFRQSPYDSAERARILDTIARGGARELALLHVALGERFAGAVLELLAHARVTAREIEFVASHGQTVWHEPARATLQLGDPAVLAERVGVPVVSDFRTRDVAAGGHSAPLVPLVDVLVFGHPDRGRLLLNLGGIANVTWVSRRGESAGAVAFDTGPGVGVMDAVTRLVCPDLPFDQDGERARHGRVLVPVLESMLENPYFAERPPKSTGPERFGPAFAQQLAAAARGAGGEPDDAISTANALTVETVADAIERFTPAQPDDELVISGGGTRNRTLVDRLKKRLRPRPVLRFDDLFFDGEAKEAAAFALLGLLTLRGIPGNLPSVTGARGARVLGRITPA